MGRLQRIAALTALATTSVMVAGVVNVPAVGLTTPEVTTTVPTTTVPSTTVTVPSTSVTPTTTVTTPPVKTPTVTTPSTSTPTVTAPTVKTPTVKTPSVSTPTVKTPTLSQQSSPTSGGGGGSSIKQQAASTVDTVSGLTSAGTSGTVSGAKGTVTGAAGGGGTVGGAAGGAGGGGNAALQALSFFDGGGPGAGSGHAGGGSAFGGGAAGGGLPPALSAAGAKRLRAALELLEGCMSAIAPLDRQVLGMRAGAPGVAPLSRSQVAARLGVSTRQVRLSERRGLSGLRVAAEQTGCAGPVGGPFAVSGIGPLPLATLAGAPGALLAAGGDATGAGDYVAARQAIPGAESPLAGLSGNGQSGPAWLVVLITVLFSVAIAGLMRELRGSVGAPPPTY